MTPKKPTRVLGIIFLIASAMLALPFIIGQWQLAADTSLFNLNMRGLYIFFHFYDAELFQNDYAANYFLRMWTPPGFLALQYLWAEFADPLLLHRYLSPVLWLASAPMVFFSAKRLGGLANAWATLGIYLSSSVFMFRMSAGVPHSFGFPICWWVVSALLAGRPKSLIAATAASAAIYPFMVPIAGLTLALWLFFPRLAPTVPRTAPELRWTWLYKLLLLAGTAAVALVLMGQIFTSHFITDYGRPIHVLQENMEFPESGPVGRNNVYTTQAQPLVYLALMFMFQNAARLGATASVIITLIGIAVLLAGILLHDPRDQRPAALKPFLFAAALCFLGSLLATPRMAYHFALYPAPVLLTLCLPLALRRISRVFPAGKKGAAFAFMTLAYMSSIAGAQPEASGYINSLDGVQTGALAFIATLPKDAVFAGWPGEDYGKIVENIPYFARRKALVTWESHTSLHTGYVLVMRSRMNALIDAYLARDIAPLIRLRDQFHVDYLVVNEADLTGAEPPRYFEPFNERTQKLWKENHNSFIALKLAKTISVYSKDGIDILDLHRL